MKNGCTKCAIPTQFIVLRRCSIRMDVGNKIFSNAFEPSATTSGFSWQNEASNSSRPNHQKERRPKFAIRLVVASYLPVTGRRAGDLARLYNWLVSRCWQRDAAVDVHARAC